jgi:hypothetical protein
MAVQRMVVVTAQRHREFIAHLASQHVRLGKFQVVGIAWRTLTDQARVRRDKSKVRLVSPANLLG